MSVFLSLLAPVIKALLEFWTAKQSAEMVKAAKAKDVALDTDQIRQLIHTAHFGSTPQRKAAALLELQKLGAAT